MHKDALLQVSGLSCVRQQALIFNDISFELHASDMLLVEGPNGSGKSSLLRLLTGLATPASGEIRWRTHCIQRLGVEYSQELHYIGHMNGLKLGLTVGENLLLACVIQKSDCSSDSCVILRSAFCDEGSPNDPRKIDGDPSAQRARLRMTRSCDEAITKIKGILLHLQLHHLLNTQVKHLSAGQKRRVALAKLFLFPKPLWILDEPLTSLDIHTQQYFLQQLEQHLQQNGVAIITSHQPFRLPRISPQVLRLAC